MVLGFAGGWALLSHDAFFEVVDFIGATDSWLGPRCSCRAWAAAIRKRCSHSVERARRIEQSRIARYIDIRMGLRTGIDAGAVLDAVWLRLKARVCLENASSSPFKLKKQHRVGGSIHVHLTKRREIRLLLSELTMGPTHLDGIRVVSSVMARTVPIGRLTEERDQMPLWSPPCRSKCGHMVLRSWHTSVCGVVVAATPGEDGENDPEIANVAIFAPMWILIYGLAPMLKPKASLDDLTPLYGMEGLRVAVDLRTSTSVKRRLRFEPTRAIRGNFSMDAKTRMFFAELGVVEKFTSMNLDEDDPLQMMLPWRWGVWRGVFENVLLADVSIANENAREFLVHSGFARFSACMPDSLEARSLAMDLDWSARCGDFPWIIVQTCIVLPFKVSIRLVIAHCPGGAEEVRGAFIELPFESIDLFFGTRYAHNPPALVQQTETSVRREQ